MHIGFDGRLVNERPIRAGFIGCGSHAFRNVYPALQFAPVDLVATCDLDAAKAKAFARRFGAPRAYDDHRRMLNDGTLEAVFLVVGYDARGRPLYPDLVVECLEAGLHVWLEKPPAASCAEIERMAAAARRARRHVLVGLKKMFAPANEKARALMSEPDFGTPSLVTLQYPQYVPTREEFAAYFHRGESNRVRGFLDHLCHPASVLVLLLGMPASLHYERADSGSGVATFTFDSGAVASMALTHGASLNGGMERTAIVSDRGRHLTVENNLRVTYHRAARLPYGRSPDFYVGRLEETSAVWEPEFSLGQLYNKGLFLLGYYHEVNEFVRAILDERPPARGTLRDAWCVTRLFEAFAEGPGRTVSLEPCPLD